MPFPTWSYKQHLGHSSLQSMTSTNHHGSMWRSLWRSRRGNAEQGWKIHRPNSHSKQWSVPRPWGILSTVDLFHSRARCIFQLPRGCAYVVVFERSALTSPSAHSSLAACRRDQLLDHKKHGLSPLSTNSAPHRLTLLYPKCFNRSAHYCCTGSLVLQLALAWLQSSSLGLVSHSCHLFWRKLSQLLGSTS